MKSCPRCGSHGPFRKNKREKDGLSFYCAACYRELDHQYRLNNLEQRRAQDRARYAANLDHFCEVQRKRRERNPQENPERCRRYVRENYETLKPKWREWYLKNRVAVSARAKVNRAKIRDRERAYRSAHPEADRQKHNIRRAALAGVPRTLTREQWAEILEVFGYRCAYCLTSGQPLGQEHVVPISRGGGHAADNVVPACQSCNSKKGNRPVFMMARFIT